MYNYTKYFERSKVAVSVKLGLEVNDVSIVYNNILGGKKAW